MISELQHEEPSAVITCSKSRFCNVQFAHVFVLKLNCQFTAL